MPQGLNIIFFDFLETFNDVDILFLDDVNSRAMIGLSAKPHFIICSKFKSLARLSLRCMLVLLKVIHCVDKYNKPVYFDPKLI